VATSYREAASEARRVARIRGPDVEVRVVCAQGGGHELLIVGRRCEAGSAAWQTGGVFPDPVARRPVESDPPPSDAA